MRRRRTLRQNVQHVFGVLHSPARGETMTQHDLLAGIMHLRSEDESATLRRRLDRPAGERARDVDDILLGVSAVDAERVELQQFTPVVLVKSGVLPLLLLLLLWPLHGYA